MNGKLKKACQVVVILISGGVVGILLLLAVYRIPISFIMDHYLTSLNSIESREGWHRYIFGYDLSTLDNNTEFLMLKAAGTPMPHTEENYVQKVLRCYTFNSEWNHGLAFAQGEYNGQNFTCDSYERYWHGYLVLLKPLLIFFTYQDLIYLNIIFQSMLLFILFKQLKNCGGGGYLQLPFLFSWIAGMQMIVMLSLDYSVCFYIYTLSALSVLRFPKCREKYGLFFMFIGMLTSYMDLLTWPLVTLAVPLMILIQYAMSVGEKLKRIMIASGAWGLGYITQWSFKWLSATLILDDNVLADAIESLLFRSALSEKDAVTWGDVVMKNLFVFQNTPCLLLGGAGALLTVVFACRNRRKIQWRNMIPSLLIAAAPFFWYLVTKNHAYEHYWMTWRNLSITVFAVYGGLAGSVLQGINEVSN